ncbi:MAG: iron-containing alcohol dehydrogenase [Prevotella sp.]|nr:iron-containing alcohol dehydrogenase [Prevotella sp.]
MREIILQQPQKIVFGSGCIHTFVKDYLELGCRRLFILTAPPILPLIEEVLGQLCQAGIKTEIYDHIMAEPTIGDFKQICAAAQAFHADSVVGIGGGSVLDVAKLVATLFDGAQEVEDVFGIGFIRKKGLWLACLPTTAGTGSEVSPNAILLDERDKLKKGIVSPYLLADVAYVDPALTLTVPSKVTADTGMDALTHCIEAYTNKFAHPMVDMYALRGIELLAKNLRRAVENGSDLEAREACALGSLYGGLCLGPVNTAAVHALSYPLGGEYHIPHGLSNAILLPSVMKFNCPANQGKYAEVAIACGVSRGKDDDETAQRGVDFICQLSQAVGIPSHLDDIGIPKEAVPHLAKAAMEVQRLLKNNPREVTEQDAIDIYNTLYK